MKTKIEVHVGVRMCNLRFEVDDPSGDLGLERNVDMGLWKISVK